MVRSPLSGVLAHKQGYPLTSAGLAAPAAIPGQRGQRVQLDNAIGVKHTREVVGLGQRNGSRGS